MDSVVPPISGPLDKARAGVYIDFGRDTMTAEEACAAAAKHAITCRKCFMPIMDEEGNPGYFAEACRQGLPLLVAYVQAIGEDVPQVYLDTLAPGV